MAIFLAIPRMLKHWGQWQATRDEKELATVFSHFLGGLFFLAAIFAVVVKNLCLYWPRSGSSIGSWFFLASWALVTWVFVPRAIRHFFRWKTTRKTGQFTLSVIFGFCALVFLWVWFAAGIKVFLEPGGL